MNAKTEPTLRRMTRSELTELVDWAASEGWNPGLHDAELFWQTDPDGYVAAELDGEFIGGGAIVSYDGAFGFMGLFIVRPEYRGHGYGDALWHERKRLLQGRLQLGAAIGLDGVFEMQAWYGRGGFVMAGRNIRYRATAAATERAESIVLLEEIPFADVHGYDRRCFPAPRERFLRAWIDQPDSLALASCKDGALAGFGVIRRCRVGAKIGPLFADDAATAAELHDALAGFVAGEPVFLDVPETNHDAVKLAADRGMEQVFGTARMYLGGPPALPLDRIFGVTTFELG